MPSRLHAPRNRSRLHAIICVLMVSWLFMVVSNTCAMPASAFTASADAMPAGCTEMDASTLHTVMSDQDCSFKPCLDSHPDPAFELKIDKPQTPIFVLCLIGLIGSIFHCLTRQRVPPAAAPPIGRRVLLIYRFCTLLN